MPASAVEAGSNENIGPAKGLLGFLKRLWFNFMVVFIGGKWSLIETVTKHKKLSEEEIPRNVQGETVVITGGARGIGAEVVKQCLLLDMNVIIGCRKPAAGESTVQAFRAQGILTGSAEALPLDLNSLTSVRQFAQAILNKNLPIHRLICNAGIMFHPFQMTTDGNESQFQTNYLSHFLLTTLLQPALNQGGKPNAPSRVVNVSSAAQYGGQIDFENIDMKNEYSPHMSYMSSKLMQVVSTMDLNRRYQHEKMNIRVYALHPGVVKTDLYENVWWVHFFGRLLNVLFRTPEQGADGVTFVALSQTVNQDGGVFYANCAEQPVNPLALNPEIQEKLHQLSTRLCESNNNNSDVSRNSQNGGKFSDGVTVHLK